MPVDHYENFPVASWLLPKRLRRPVEAIYRFARSADDIADEGDASPAERLAQLAAYHAELDRIERGETPTDPVFGPLADAIRTHAIPLAPFRDLLSAFAQDVEKKRYASFGEVMDYCRRSANPVGRLMLHLYGDHDPRHLAYSDAICSSLQLIAGASPCIEDDPVCICFRNNLSHPFVMIFFPCTVIPWIICNEKSCTSHS